MPFENSSNGSVAFTLDCLADIHGRYPDIVVCGEVYIPVRHCLVGYAPKGETHQQPSKHDLASRKLEDEASKLEDEARKLMDKARELKDKARKVKNEAESPDISGQATPTRSAPQPAEPRVKPLHSVKHIKKIYSHPQAWGQCKSFLSTYVKHTERQDVSSTSKAAELVAQDTTGTTAAISSKLAADLNGIDILAEGIEDSEGNTTRFLILQRREDAMPLEKHTSFTETPDDRKQKSLVTFTIDHYEPGALSDSLAVFRQNGLGLTNLEKRPNGKSPWEYVWLAEFGGTGRLEGKIGALSTALEELTKVAESCRPLGSWKNQLER